MGNRKENYETIYQFIKKHFQILSGRLSSNIDKEISRILIIEETEALIEKYYTSKGVNKFYLKKVILAVTNQYFNYLKDINQYYDVDLVELYERLLDI